MSHFFRCGERPEPDTLTFHCVLTGTAPVQNTLNPVPNLRVYDLLHIKGCHPGDGPGNWRDTLHLSITFRLLPIVEPRLGIPASTVSAIPSPFAVELKDVGPEPYIRCIKLLLFRDSRRSNMGKAGIASEHNRLERP